MVAPSESYPNPVEDLLDRLDGVEEHANYWKALCPVHADHDPSLSVSEGKDGRALLKCHAGCETPEIVDALGLTMRDHFPSPNGHIGGGRGKRPFPVRLTPPVETLRRAPTF
jgi:hypothetical protein